MTTPRRGLLFHFTHVDNLPGIAAEGLLCDPLAASRGLLTIDVGHEDVKERRRHRRVPIQPGGVVADYVPFYFAARSPMLYVIDRDDVSTYHGGQDGLVHLVTDVDTIVRRNLRFVFTDHNAATDYARFSDQLDRLDDFVDWPLMESQWWNNISTDPDRQARRMAEFLVHGAVPWDAFVEIAARTDEDAARATAALTKVNVEAVIRVRQDWYY